MAFPWGTSSPVTARKTFPAPCQKEWVLLVSGLEGAGAAICLCHPRGAEPEAIMPEDCVLL